MKTKQQFIDNPKRRNLSNREKERRWRQYVISQRSIAVERRTGRTRGTRIKIKANNQLSLKLTPCAKHYLIAVGAPFSHKGVACIPDLHAVPSKKIRVKTRGTFSTGVNGYGYIIANDWANSNDYAVASYTINTYAGTDTIAEPSTLPAGVNNAIQAKLPYASASFGSALRARTVGFGLRIRYIGPELARSGQIIGLRHPDNANLVGKTRAQFRSFETSKTFSNKKQWIYVLYRPVEPEDYEFTASPSANEKGVIKYSMGFFVSDTTDSTGAPGPAPFEWETVRYVEYIGDIDNVTATHVDIQGMAHIRNSLPVKSSTDNMSKHVATMARKVYSSMKANAPGIVKNVAPAIGGALAYKNFIAPAIDYSEPLIEELPALEAEAPSILESALPVVEELAPFLLL